MHKGSAERRFWSKVDRNGPIPECCPELGPCWLWTAYKDPVDGYGRFEWVTADGAHDTLAHRYAYALAHGVPPAKGMHTDHLCRNRGCVRSGHLEEVTPQQNSLRGETLMARRRAQTECVNGHPFDLDNTAINSRGHRRCRTCTNIKSNAIRRTEKGHEWAKAKRAQEKNREYQREYQRRWNIEHREEITTRQRLLRQARRVERELAGGNRPST